MYDRLLRKRREEPVSGFSFLVVSRFVACTQSHYAPEGLKLGRIEVYYEHLAPDGAIPYALWYQ